MIKLAIQGAAIFLGSLVLSAVIIVVGTAIFGHRGQGLISALIAQLGLWIGAFILLWRLSKRSTAAKPWIVPVVWLVLVAALASPLAIATALSFDH